MKVIGQAHSVVHAKGVVRVQSSMRVGTRYFPLYYLTTQPYEFSTRTEPLVRTDKKQTASDKVKRVEDILAKQGGAGTESSGS